MTASKSNGNIYWPWTQLNRSGLSHLPMPNHSLSTSRRMMHLWLSLTALMVYHSLGIHSMIRTLRRNGPSSIPPRRFCKNLLKSTCPSQISFGTISARPQQKQDRSIPKTPRIRRTIQTASSWTLSSQPRFPSLRLSVGHTRHRSQ